MDPLRECHPKQKTHTHTHTNTNKESFELGHGFELCLFEIWKERDVPRCVNAPSCKFRNRQRRRVILVRELKQKDVPRDEDIPVSNMLKSTSWTFRNSLGLKNRFLFSSIAQRKVSICHRRHFVSTQLSFYVAGLSFMNETSRRLRVS